jgi:hypothetical protein
MAHCFGVEWEQASATPTKPCLNWCKNPNIFPWFFSEWPKIGPLASQSARES